MGMQRLFLILISIVAILVALCLFLRNKHPAVWESFLFISGMDKIERAEWKFEPGQFSFSDTNRTYEVVFEPQRALPHEIKLLFDECIKVYVDPGRIDGYYREDMMADMVTRMTVRHCGTDRILTETICKDPKAGWVFDYKSGASTGNVAQVECTLFSLSPHRWNRRIHDRLKVQVQMLCPPRCCRFWKGGAVHLVVSEGYPFK